MVRLILFLAPLAFCAAIALADPSPATKLPVQPETGPGTPPTTMPNPFATDKIIVQRLGHAPIPHCPGDSTDSLRFTHCYPVLEEGVVRRPDWSKDLSRIVKSRMVPWNHDSCGYEPQAVVRMVSSPPSELVVFTSRCDSSRVGLLTIGPGVPMEHAELALGGPILLGLLAEVLPIHGVEARVRRESADPEEGEFVSYDEEPTPIERRQPVRSEFAKEALITGKVTLHILVGTDGRAHQVRVVKGVAGLNESAVDCVRGWTWKPARSNGKPVAVWVEIPIDFR